MGTEPTEEQLRAFVATMLSNLDKSFLDADAIDDSVRAHRGMWVMLYLASSDFDIERGGTGTSS